ncbi:hypothetical protein GCM10027053_09020 [Intrasporangium mesophilum]
MRTVRFSLIGAAGMLLIEGLLPIAAAARPASVPVVGTKPLPWLVATRTASFGRNATPPRAR